MITCEKDCNPRRCVDPCFSGVRNMFDFDQISTYCPINNFDGNGSGPIGDEARMCRETRIIKKISDQGQEVSEIILFECQYRCPGKIAFDIYKEEIHRENM